MLGEKKSGFHRSMHASLLEMEMARLSEDDAAREDKLYRHFGDNRLLQNDLPGCRVVLFPRQAAYLFLIIGFTFLLIGLYVERMSSDIHEIRVRYDDVCRTTSSNTSSLSPPPCQLQVKIPEDLSQPVFVYYSLEEFFQNHRGYITSFSAAQISGEMISESDARKTCSPAAFNGDGTPTGGYTDADASSMKIILPCGLLPNSVFNDSFAASHCPYGNMSKCRILSGERWSKRDIAWASDRSKFKDRQLQNDTETRFGYFNYRLPDVDDPDLIVWMRPGRSRPVTKLHRRIGGGLKLRKGDVLLVNVTNRFSLDPNRKTPAKHLLISNTNDLGGKNEFLPRMYIAVGGLGLLLSSALFGGVFVTRRKERTLRSRNFTNSTNSIGGDSSWAGWRHDVKH